MEGASNGGMLYHEVQESKLCAVHCVNTVLQGPFFSEFDLAALASDLDSKERQMMLQGTTTAAAGDFLSEESHNVSLGGDFSIQVLEKALEVWDLQVIPLDCPVAEPAQIDPELENAFICHLHDHWFCIRKVNGEWYNFDSLYAAPQHFSKFYLSAYLDSLKGSGWSIFLVRGNFPKECPISSSEASNGYGQWLSPEDAERITKSCNLTQAPPQRNNMSQQQHTERLPSLAETDLQMLSDMEDEDLRAAIAASLMDSSPATASGESSIPKTENKDIPEVLSLQNVLNQADESLHAESTRLLPFLDQLDPSKHSLGYLYFLEACTAGPVTTESASSFVLVIARFISSCVAEQIRLAPDKFISVCKRFKDQVLLLEEPLRGVAPMLTAVRKLQSSTEHLTTLHPEFLLLCLLAKCYKTGLSILEEDIFEVDQPRDLYLYCYYGGMICIGQKCFRKALELLHNVVTAPMSTINAIAVEAYKKYILVSLIHHGQLSTSLPKYASGVAQRNLKSLCLSYIELANSYNNGKIADLETYVQANMEKFGSDNNLGLVKQVVSSIYKRNIQRLTQTYLTLSLQDIANTVQLNSPKEAEMHVLQMIQDGEIYATINQKDGMVRFLEDPELYKTCEMIEHIDLSIQRLMTLSKKLTVMDELISCDPLYLGKAGRERQRFDFDDFDSVPQRFNI